MKLKALGLGLSAILAAAASVWGQDAPADPPSRAARLNFIEGSVSFRPAVADDWVAATLNYPLSTGDRLWTGESSFAELHIGATAIHLPPQTAFELTYLDDTVTQMSVSSGAVYIRIPSLDTNEVVEVDTPNAAVSLLQAGAYRVDVDEASNTTTVSVRSGEAEVTVNGKPQRVRAGATLQIAGTEASEIASAPPDAWETACAAGDQLAEDSRVVSENYVSPQMDGAEDLAWYGEWSTDDTYGDVWSPAGLPAGWAPYRDGHWAHVPAWGWTWIDEAKWGFAPFHYGRWVFSGGRWLWLPGNRRQPPVFSPAMVAFVGGARFQSAIPNFHVALTAWIPLGAGEFYRPQRPVSTRYLSRVNAPVFGNRPVPVEGQPSFKNREHVIAVPAATFAGGRPVAPSAVRVPREAGAVAGPVGIADVRPARQRPSDAGQGVATPPQGLISRRVVVKHEVPGTPASTATAPPAQVDQPVAGRRVAPPPGVAAPPRVEQQRLDRQPVDQRVEQQPAEQQRAEQQRFVQQRADQQRAEQQRADQQRADQQRVAQQRAEQQRTDQQRAEQQRAEQLRVDQQRADQQRADQQRAEQLRADQQRADQQRAEQQRAEQQRAEQQRAEQQRAEQLRADQQRADQQRAEQLRAEQQRADQQRAEQHRAEQQRAEQQRADQQRADQQRADQQRAEDARKADEAKKAEEARKKQ